MKPRLHPAQAAWLTEIGLDLHWVEIQPIAAAQPTQDPEAAPAPVRVADAPQAPARPAADRPV
ncbi:MAG: hypothetical protein WBF69_11115, partial [Castellaniella sp.]